MVVFYVLWIFYGVLITIHDGMEVGKLEGCRL